jgi:hypothetical protein
VQVPEQKQVTAQALIATDQECVGRRAEGGAVRGMGSLGTTPKAAQNLHANELQDSVTACGLWVDAV